jgi:hypothetical protein
LTELITMYENPVDNFNIIASLFFFFLFLFFMIFLKLASGEDCYSKMNKLHFRLYFAYLIASGLYYFTLSNTASFSLLSLSVGTFIYFSLHYVYLFSLVGLSKKSISMNILAEAQKMIKSGRELSSTHLLDHLNDSSINLEFIRENRLKQMIILGWSSKEGERYHLTPKGRLFNKMGSLVLKIWNLGRQ